MKTIKFTNREVEALLHRLTAWDCIAEVFADTDGLEHLADDAVTLSQDWVRELQSTRKLIVDESSELHRELLLEVIEGSTWVAIHDPENDTNNSRQAHTAAYQTLCRCADKISLAFDILVSEIDIPTV